MDVKMYSIKNKSDTLWSLYSTLAGLHNYCKIAAIVLNADGTIRHLIGTIMVFFIMEILWAKCLLRLHFVPPFPIGHDSAKHELNEVMQWI